MSTLRASLDRQLNHGATDLLVAQIHGNQTALKLLRASGARNPDLRLIRAAQRRIDVETGTLGLRLRALQSRPGLAYLILLDGDGQHLPEEIPAFLAEANSSGAAMLIGALAVTVMLTWQRGAQVVTSKRIAQEGSLSAFIEEMRRRLEKTIGTLAPGFEADIVTDQQAPIYLVLAQFNR